MSFGSSVGYDVSSLHSGFFHPLLRRWQSSCNPGPCVDNLIYPLFVTDGVSAVEKIDSLPGQMRFSVDKLIENVQPLVDKGLKSVLLFGVIDK